MPTYAYACRNCHADSEVKQRITEAPLTRCDACGADALERKIFASGFVLKGGGWYADGYGSGGKKSESSPSASST